MPLLRSAWRQQGRIIGVGCGAVHIFDAQHSRCGNTTRSAFAGNTKRGRAMGASHAQTVA
ncbi:hypothetical protein Xmlh_17885 [Xanthomonas axonopodis pv. melhusii]|uniref:Uncharacterized protein n=1 Tax=Xanthomonas axonopodis pv. melhusii TaxID=487834 RepID=A0A1T1NVV5_9XANT|nr:hypothetical protein Xmlh_17885 [Xanthomonas axonopodis pv. melhusii]